VAWFVAVIDAFGITAPLGSVTEPRIDPVMVCAFAQLLASINPNTANRARTGFANLCDIAVNCLLKLLVPLREGHLPSCRPLSLTGELLMELLAFEKVRNHPGAA